MGECLLSAGTPDTAVRSVKPHFDRPLVGTGPSGKGSRLYKTQMPEKNCYLVAAVHAGPLFSSAEFAGWAFRKRVASIQNTNA